MIRPLSLNTPWHSSCHDCSIALCLRLHSVRCRTVGKRLAKHQDSRLPYHWIATAALIGFVLACVAERTPNPKRRCARPL
ncbi:hypothetical protein K491DRAFT_321421 [Lophiostoma macrostomum CBS 122681]|uniref:Uncharacterized protein n=1 Tax=Lophiostoma macrostomum CBS 122681 TaxID=1314788 RepID=A0A6A6TCY3_9PLEO|nr:hypothetical protein K491DRAFT_321421 [Lophiostoma macrostomum CBS 122681]